METQSILIVDDNAADRELMKRQLQKRGFNVETAIDAETARQALKTQNFEACLIDLRLGKEDGGQLAAESRSRYPKMAIVLMSGESDNFISSTPGFEYRFVKSFDDQTLAEIVKTAISRKNKHADDIKSSYPLLEDCKETLSGIFFEPISEDQRGSVEKIGGITAKDGHSLFWNTYTLNVREHKGIFTIGVTPTIGCGLKCAYCLSGRKPFARGFTEKEILAQIAHGFRSLHAEGVSTGKVTPHVSFTCEGESFRNQKVMRNVMYAIKNLILMKAASGVIITTIGLEKQLRDFLTKYVNNPDWIDICKRIRIYFSLVFAGQASREKYMPATKGQVLENCRDILREIATKTGNRVTVAYMVVPGLNDHFKDALRIAELFGTGQPFDIKLSPYAPAEDKVRVLEWETATKHQIGIFKAKLKKADPDLNVRDRPIAAAEGYAGCGSTVQKGLSDYGINPDEEDE